MSFKSPRLPLPLNGRRITSSASSGGIPRNERTGVSVDIKKLLTPEIFMISTKINIATKYGKIEITKSTADLAPFEKWSYAGIFLTKQSSKV